LLSSYKNKSKTSWNIINNEIGTASSKTFTQAEFKVDKKMIGTNQSAKIFNNCFIDSNKSKAIPLQAWSGSEGSRKLTFPDFMTSALEGGKVVRLMHRPHLPPGNSPGAHFC